MIKTLIHPLICVVGPTASGKTAVAQLIAEHLDAAVLSADSMQVYKGMDIGTGKISMTERTVEYYGLDLVDPGSPYSAALFQEYGRGAIESLDAQEMRVVVCGGTGFYVRALVDNFIFPSGEQVGNPVRDKYSDLFQQQGAQAVWNELEKKDPLSAHVISVNDTKRVIRALEMCEEGQSYAVQKDKFQHIEAFYPTCMIGLHVENSVLVERIENRVDAMVASGLVDEVQGLLDNGYRSAITANQAIGYKEVVEYLDGSIALDQAIDKIKTATRQYAKRQRTWFKKDTRIHWVDATEFDAKSLCAKSLEIIASVDGGA